VVSASSDGTLERQVTLPADTALHARPAGALVREAARHAATLTLVAGERRADARSILQIMALGLPGGSTLTVRAEGQDAEPALEAVVALLEQLG
jgi:phosphotransferase system HPr (HPr) family protein